MTIHDPINVGNPYGASAAEYLQGEVFTGEALLLYVQTRLTDLDEQIQSLMGQAEKAIEMKKFLNEVKRWGEDMLAVQRRGGTPEEIQAQTDALNDQFPEAPPGQRGLGVKLYNSYHSMAPAGEGRTEENVERFNNYVDSIVDDINGQNEITMIRMQQLIAQRQLAVSMTTNLLTKQHETMMAPANNI